MKNPFTLSFQVFLAGLFAFNQVNAQIVYTDIIPDVLLSYPTNPTYLLDLNNDMTQNFALSVQPVNEEVSGTTIEGHAAGIFSLAAGSEFIAQQDALFPLMLVTKLPHQAVIDASGSYTTGTPDIEGGMLRGIATAPFAYSFGNFSNAVNAFIGVKIELGADTHYGWIRVDVDANGTEMTVKDYAYESTAGVPIEAGRDDQGNWVAVMENNLANSLSLIVASEYIQVSEMSGKRVQAEVYSIDGKRLINKSFLGSDVIYFDGLSTGIYTVRFSAENGTFTQKFFVR